MPRIVFPFLLLLLPSWAWVSHHFSTRKTAWTIRNAYANGANGSGSGADPVKEANMGLNELQTLLRDAAQRQDFMEAGRLSDILATRLYGDMTNLDDETRRLRRRQMSWRGLGAAPWLVDRLDSINYTFPTTIQINAMGAVNAILNTTNELVESTSLEERIGIENQNMGVVISGNTGSGTLVAWMCMCKMNLCANFSYYS